MPQLMPTADEVRAMPPRQKERAIKAIRAVLDATDAFIDETLIGYNLTAEQRLEARRAVWSVMRIADDECAEKVGGRIADQARVIERTLRTEPEWVTAARRAALLEAVR